MIIDRNNPHVTGLEEVWNSALVRSDELSQELQGRLVQEVIAPAVQEFKGELVLKYHEFLTMVRSGAHSFAYGSEMISKTVYWVSVARIGDGEIMEVPEVVHPPCGPVDGQKLVLSTPRKFLVPILWGTYLSVRYRKNSRRPHFVITPKKSNEEMSTFDVAYFGEQLFRLRRGKHDWATKVQIIVGNESVGKWMKEAKSAGTYNQLQRK
ncbi:MAG: hypothetical protein WAW13_02965 [Minisyncoccia bacterium]